MPADQLLIQEKIEKNLEWFGISLNIEIKSQIRDLLSKGSVSDCYDHFLLPLLPFLNDYGKTTHEFRGFIALCFKGDLSFKAWDKVWSRFKDKDEQLFYATTDYYLGYPLEIAAHNNYLDGLKRLDNIYSVQPHQYRVHRMLHDALAGCYLSREDTRCFDFLLSLCERYAESSPGGSFLDKTLAYRTREPFVDKKGSTSLLEFFSKVAQTYIMNGSLIKLSRLCNFIKSKNVSEEMFNAFKQPLIDELNQQTTEEEQKDSPVYQKALSILNGTFTSTAFHQEEASSEKSEEAPQAGATSKVTASVSKAPDSITFFKKEPSQHDETVKDFGLSTAERFRIHAMIVTLEKETNSLFSMNPVRKAHKIEGLRKLLEYTDTMDTLLAIQTVEKEFPDIRKGFISTRTATLLNTLREFTSPKIA